MQTKSRFKKVKTVLLVAIIIGLFIAMNRFGLDKPIRNTFLTAGLPIQEFFWKVGNSFSESLDLLAKTKNLVQNLDQVEKENQKLKTENLNLQNLQSENEKLRRALDLNLEKQFKLDLVHVVAKNPFQDEILINKGLKDGLLENMPVITENKILVGKIKTCLNNFAWVSLISDKNISFGAEIQSEEKISGLAKGQGNLKILFDLIPQGKTAAKQDLVLTSGLEGTFPKGLLAGQVIKTNPSEIKPFQSAKIEPAFKITDLETVFIIIDF